MPKLQLGRWGEGVAADHLVLRGWTIVHRNFRAGRREIDLIASRGDVVAFVEVKTRSGPNFGHPLESITRSKRREIERAAEIWVTLHGVPRSTYRFDALTIVRGPRGLPVVEHLHDAWRG